MTEQDHLDKITEIQSRFPATQATIIALQKEYNAALDDFRKWLQQNQKPKQKNNR